jgi:hypothetical protein
VQEQIKITSLCVAPLSEVQHLYNEALVAQKTMQHVRSVVQHAFTFHSQSKKVPSGSRQASHIDHPLRHDAEGAGLNIVSGPRLTSEAPKILAAVQRSAPYDSLEPH